MLFMINLHYHTKKNFKNLGIFKTMFKVLNFRKHPKINVIHTFTEYRCYYIEKIEKNSFGLL